MPWQVVKRLRSSPRSASQARSFCASRLGSVLGDGPGIDELVHEAGTVVGELVTNAVNAGATWVELCLCLLTGRVRIEVSDDSGTVAAELELPAADEAS